MKHRDSVLFFLLSGAQCCGMEQGVALPVLSVDVITYGIGGCEKDKERQAIQEYVLDKKRPDEELALPWTLSPVLLKIYGTDKHLNEVLPNSQLWWKANGSSCRLAEDIRRTSDVFTYKYYKSYENGFFDGINKQDKAIYACKYQSDEPGAYYDIYGVEQSKKLGMTTTLPMGKAMCSGQGTLRSLMLELLSNRFMCSVDEGNALYKLYIKDMVVHEDESLDDLCVDVASRDMDVLFVKTVCLAQDTYFGITDEGKLYSIWLDDTQTIQCAEQKFSSQSHIFKDISVDNTVTTKTGFKPKIALLTDKGEIYVTDLCAYSQPTLFYLTKVDTSPDKLSTTFDIQRIYYHDCMISLIYAGEHKNVPVYADNFELLFLCSLFKKKALTFYGTVQ